MPQQTIPASAWDALPDAPKTTTRTQTAPSSSDQGFMRAIPGALEDVGVGALKGAGNTAFGVGQMVHSLPGVGNVTDALAKLLGPEGTDPNATFAQRPKELDATNTAQSIGKGAEQIGEFLIPAGVARKAAIEGLVRLIPDAASPGAMKVLNKAGAIIGRVAGEMGSAASVASAHGEQNPDTTAMIAGAGPLIGGAAASAVENPLARKIMANMGGGAAADAMPFKGFGLTMGTFGTVRDILERILSSQGAQKTIPKAASVAGRLAAGAHSELAQ